MTRKPAVLHLVCGKIAAGKSTLTARLGALPNTVVVSEDIWLSTLFPDNKTVEDYIRCSARLRAVVGPHVVSLLKTGISIVLDFPANTVANRRWMRSLFETSGSDHQLHFLDVSDEVCKARMRARNESGEHPYTVTDEQFALITSHFVAPQPDEGLNICLHGAYDAAATLSDD